MDICSNKMTMDKVKSEHRKSSKPMMEKRRRARINQSLNQLKVLILDALKKDSSRHSKLEKADILEMTVKHLRTLQRQQVAASANSDPSTLSKFRAGYNECVNEVVRFVGGPGVDGIDPDIRARLLSHLSNCCNGLAIAGTDRAAPSSPNGQSIQFQYTPVHSQAGVKLVGSPPCSVVGPPAHTFANKLPVNAAGGNLILTRARVPETIAGGNGNVFATRLILPRSDPSMRPGDIALVLPTHHINGPQHMVLGHTHNNNNIISKGLLPEHYHNHHSPQTIHPPRTGSVESTGSPPPSGEDTDKVWRPWQK